MSAFPRLLAPVATAIAMAIAGVSGCTGTEEGLAGLGPRTPSAPPKGDLTGGVGGSGATATPTPTPSPTPSPTPTPQIVALAVSISPATLKLSVPAGAGTGALANYPTTATLSAVVTMSDGSTTSAVSWVSQSPLIASVDASGALTVLAPGAGAGPWTVPITATSKDAQATGVRTVTVTNEGEVTLDVQ